jgi:hypothetical protein
MRSLDDRRFRARPELEAVAVCDLPADHRPSVLSNAGRDVWAVLRRRDTGEYAAGLDHEAAVLFCSLSEPQTPPAALARLPARRRRRLLARLVCDQVLEIESADGSFVAGVLAYGDLFGDDLLPDADAQRQLDPLSRSAIAHVLALPPLPSAALARRLYAFNATPRTRRWEEMLDGRGAVDHWLGLETPSPWRSALRERHAEHRSTGDDSRWLQWTRRDVDPHTIVRHKIYVCPASARLPEALRRVAEVCRALDVPAFKVGTTLAGILRADKLVVYVRDEPALWRVAGELSAALDGIDAQGVPFTAPIDSAGLLSWAVDPAARALLGPDDQPWSWRTAVVGRLADAISGARGKGSDAVIANFALERLRLDGIEAIGWRPGEDWPSP